MSPENEKSSPGTRATGKSYAVGSPCLASASISLPPGIAEPEQPRALVERLAGRVVERRPEHAVAAALLHVEQHRVAAAREQAGERRLEVERLQIERGDVPVQVVDGDQRQPPRPRERLRRRDADEQRADQARAAR